MKKLLIVGLSVAMGTALALGITACGKKGNSDADTAKEAIKTVTNLHASVGTETPTSYKVTGATRVGTQVVTVEWSVTSTYEGYADYVSVGEKGADQQVAINITQHEEDAIDYTLTASVTVGKATETKDFSHTIPAGGKIYTPSEAKTLAGTLDADAYYMEEGVVTAINVKGYVVAIEGGWNTQYNELQKVYIGDTAETAKTDALYVFYIDSDPVYMTKEFDVEVGDLITVRGALQNYKGNTPELTYNGTGESRIDPVIVAPIQKAPKTDAQILDDAKNALKINEYYSATGDYDLPVPIKDVTATWALEGGNNEYVKVEDGKLTVLKLPDSETSYKLTATLSYGTATPVKAEFTIKLGKLALTHAGTEADPFTPAEALTIAATLADKQYYSDTNGVKAVYVKGKVVDVGTWKGGNYNNYNKVYIIAEDAYTSTATKDTTGAILVYRIASDPQLTEGTLKHGDTLLLLCGIQRYGETYELGSTKGSSDSSNSATLVTYTPGVDERTAQEKVNDALEALAATFTVTKTGETELPASTVTGVTFAWSTEDKTYTITGNKIKVDALPTADATVTATVTATCGTESVTNNTKTVTITIRAQGTTPEESATLDFGVQANRTVFTAEQQVWTANGITLTNDKADSATDITNNTSTEHIRLYNSSKVKIEYTSAIAQIVFHSCAAINTSNYPGNVKTNFEALGGTTVTVSGDDVTVVFATPTTSIELTVSSQMRLLSMDVSTKAGTVTPGPEEPDPTPDKGHFDEVTTEFPTKTIPEIKALVPNTNDTTTESYYVLGAVKSFDSSSYYCNFHICDADDNDLYVYGLYKEDGSQIIDITTAKGLFEVGDIVVLYGTLKNYNGNAQIVNAWLVQIENDAKTDEAKILLAGVNLTTPVTEDFNLPTLDGKVSWAVTSGTGIKIENNVAKVTRTETDQTVVLTATAKVGTKTATKEFTIVVSLEKAGYEEVVLTAATLLPDLKSAYGANGTATIAGYGFSWIGMGNYGLLQMRTNTSTGTSSFWNTQAFKENISKVVFTWADSKSLPSKTNVLKVEFANSVDFTSATSQTISFTEKTLEVAVTGEYKYVRITHNNQGAVYLDEVKIICEAAASATVQAPAQVAILPGKEF